MKLKNSKIFWGRIPQTPLVSSAFCTANSLIKAGRGLGTRLFTNVVCSCCALALALFWLRHLGYGETYIVSERRLKGQRSGVEPPQSTISAKKQQQRNILITKGAYLITKL